MNQKAIEVQNLKKSFGEFAAVKNVRFEVLQGEIFSLLRPKGAGKSTTISMLACLLAPTNGDARVMGYAIVKEPQKVKKMIGELDRIDLTINTESENLLSSWQRSPGVHKVYAEDGHITVLAQDSNQILPRLFELSTQEKVRITWVDIQEPNLEAVFLQLTDKALRE